MKRLLLLPLMLLAFALGAAAQRTVTPVVPVTSRPALPDKKHKTHEKPETVRPGSVIETTDDTGRTFFLDTLSGNEWVDSMALAQPKAIGNVYPLWDAVSVGIDLWPALGRAWGQKQGLGGVWARLSLHNRYFPVVEAGVSSAANRPDAMNFSYSSPVAPYFKVGMDYNFFYNSNPAYQVYAMVRYGFSRFAYDVGSITIANGYWQTVDHPEIPRQHTSTGYIEVGAGIVVKLWGPLSAGWNFKYHKVIHHSAQKYGAPWAIPGYGKRDVDLGVQLSLIYTIPLHKPIEQPTSETDTK